MSHKPSASRSSRSSAHYSPYSRSASRASPPLATSSTFRPSCLNSPPISSPSTPKHQLEHYASAPRRARPKSRQGPNRPPYPQPHGVTQPSLTTSRLEDLNSSIHQHPLHRTLGPASAQWEPTHYGKGMFSKSHNFSVKGSTFIDYNINSDIVMEKFLRHTIIGAEFDSSDRDPPPRCHPGTRLAIIERCKVFIAQCNGKEKMRWVVGPAGVGKSAIMQMVAEEAPADASVFFSVDGRRDGTKTFTTISYQLAAKYEPYRQFISKEISRDPTLLRKALPVQFRKFIVDPFIHQHLFNPSDRFVFIIDGLDECDNPSTQRELLGLISYFCLSYPISPVVWFVASRPEPHITSFFDDARVAPAYTKEEIRINSNEACEDVQRYLRAELNDIKLTYPNLEHKREWPSRLEFTKIAAASGGLFAYASTVVRYIGDSHYGDPVSQLGDVLVAINAGPKDGMPTRNNPLALLDALYERIISKIPDHVMVNTRKLLLFHLDYGCRPWDNFRKQCNRVGLAEDAAYGAVRHLHAVVKVPPPHQADDGHLTYFHKSFQDFLLRFKRSGFSLDDIELLMAQTSLRVLEQIPTNFNGMAPGESIQGDSYLEGGPGIFDNILLSWPGDERFRTTDPTLKLQLYNDSVYDMCLRFKTPSKFFWSMSCFHALTTRLIAVFPFFPFRAVTDSVFNKFRSELMDHGQLQQVPLRSLDYAAICGPIELRFTRPVGIDAKYSDPWRPVCEHGKEDVDGLQHRQGWTTSFKRPIDGSRETVAHTTACHIVPRFSIAAGKVFHWECVGGRDKMCLYCSLRLALHFIKNPDQLATVFVDSTEMCYIEVSFVDQDDGMSEWRYRFFHSGRPSCT